MKNPPTLNEEWKSFLSNQSNLDLIYRRMELGVRLDGLKVYRRRCDFSQIALTERRMARIRLEMDFINQLFETRAKKKGN